MFGGAKTEMLKAVQDPAESEHIRGLAGAFAAVEQEQREGFEALLEAVNEETDADVDAEDLLDERPDHEERVDEICAAVAARFSGSPWETWCEHVATDLENPESAEKYAGLEPEEWQEEQQQIVEDWRADDDLDTDVYDDSELVQAHLRAEFGVDVDRFEDVVIRWSPGRVFEELFAGEFEGHTTAMYGLASEVSE